MCISQTSNESPLPVALLTELSSAPHRLLFFIGAANVLTAMAWWAMWLNGAMATVAQPVPAGWMHALIMQYQVLPTFIFGFLLTVFPRWMGLEPATRWHYLPVGLGLLSGQVLTLISVFTGSALALHIGTLNTLVGWIAGMAILAGWLRQDRQRTWHARSCFAGLMVGLIGWLCFTAYLNYPAPGLALAAIKLGGFGLLVPVYATVAHRMFPFFARNVVPGYREWRPLGWLLALWPLCLLHVGLELAQQGAWLWLADLPLTLLAAYALWRWWPRGRSPALLTVLFIGFSWLPIATALYAGQSLWLLTSDTLVLGRAPVHALTVGFFGSLLVAMVTRVTQGHSGRPLILGTVALVAFIGMQMVALVRIAAELGPNPAPWWQVAAVGWLVVFTPWVLRSLWIYLTPRADAVSAGKP